MKLNTGETGNFHFLDIFFSEFGIWTKRIRIKRDLPGLYMFPGDKNLSASEGCQKNICTYMCLLLIDCNKKRSHPVRTLGGISGQSKTGTIFWFGGKAFIYLFFQTSHKRRRQILWSQLDIQRVFGDFDLPSLAANKRTHLSRCRCERPERSPGFERSRKIWLCSDFHRRNKLPNWGKKGEHVSKRPRPCSVETFCVWQREKQ